MRPIKVAVGVLNQTPLSWSQNQRNIEHAIHAARQSGASLLCLPELCITGYGCEDAFLSAGTHETALQVLGELVPQTGGIVVSVGLPLRYRGALYNSAALVVDGQVLGFACKKHLAGEGIHYEPRWFKSWPEGRQSQIRILGEDYPLGDQLFQCGDILIGFEICEDAWVANRPGVDLARQGVNIILNPSASHFAFQKHEVRRRFVVEGSRAYHVAYLYANLVGNEAGRAIYDGGGLIASAGRLVAEGPRFSYQDSAITTAVIDIEQNRLARTRAPSYQPDFESSAALAVSRFTLPAASLESRPSPQAEWEQSERAKEEEFTRAIALALFDYLRKSRSRGYVVSLSGGADSAAVAVMAALSLQLGVAELGMEQIRTKLSHIAGLDQAVHAGDLVNQLLVCVYQSTRNSSQTTRDAARAVAQSLSSEFRQIDVDALVESYVTLIEEVVGRQLDWQCDDLALQNIQARVRGPGIWLLANLRGALLLATSNRSEAALGYATMDGDTCGGVSPVAGIDKQFLRHWLHWMETMGPRDIGAIPSLSAVNAQQPTAELRPPAAGQTDEEDLMPYGILDQIERAAIRDKRTPLEVFRLLQVDRSEIVPRQLADWVKRFYRLWSRNQWKRERYAPSFHLDDENLDPKTWCRFPILSGGFERELAELDREVEALVEDD